MVVHRLGNGKSLKDSKRCSSGETEIKNDELVNSFCSSTRYVGGGGKQKSERLSDGVQTVINLIHSRER